MRHEMPLFVDYGPGLPMGDYLFCPMPIKTEHWITWHGTNYQGVSDII